MSKTNSPLLSFGARGSIGNTVSYQKHGTSTVVRGKPRPHQPNSLAQVYQRWDYQDGIYRWSLLSDAERAPYRTIGSRNHMSGYAAYMQEYLTLLPSLIARYRLDDPSSPIAYDSSKYGNDGVIFGATSAPGRIGACRDFDGVNDYLKIDPHSPLDNLSEFTWSLFFKFHGSALERFIASKITKRWDISPTTFMKFRINTTALQGVCVTNQGLTLDRWYHLAVTYSDSGDRTPHLYINAVESSYSFTRACTGTLLSDAPQPFFIGSYNAGLHFVNANIDDFTINSRVLPLPELKTRSERRYPL